MPSAEVGFGLTDLLKTLKETADLLERASRIWTGSPTVINDAVFDRVRGEQDAIAAISLTPMATDPLRGGFSIAELVGADARAAFEAFADYADGVDAVHHSIEVREKELSVLSDYQKILDNEEQDLYTMIEGVDRILPDVSWFLQELPYWYLDAKELDKMMAKRNSALREKVATGQTELAAARGRLDDLKQWNEHAAQFLDQTATLLTTDEERRRAEQIYNDLTAMFGDKQPEATRRKLAALVAAMRGANERVKERSREIRQEADRRRESNVGAGLFDLLQLLLKLGTLLDTEQTRPPPGDASKRIDIFIKYERRDYHYFRPLPPPPSQKPVEKGKLG